ncbi:hypothetical protein Tco_0555924 [Tanacetum coccineum]
MSHPEQIFVQQLGSTSIGATRAHHLYASTHGGYESVNATETEYRNHKRDLNVHIGDGDVQMLITKMTDKYRYIRNHKKTVKNGQARIRESEEYKKKPKIQSRSQKCQALSQNGQIMVNKSQ